MCFSGVLFPEQVNTQGCVGAALILIAAVATPLAGTQQARRLWFYLMSGGTVLKIVTMELARGIWFR